MQGQTVSRRRQLARATAVAVAAVVNSERARRRAAVLKGTFWI